MYKGDHIEELKNLTKILETVKPSIDAAQSTIKKTLTDEFMSELNDSQKDLINKSTELMNINFDNHEELIKKQKELVDLMANVETEINK